MTSLRTPIARALGLGSAKSGVRHWWMQRLTALALVPLSLWFVSSVIAVGTADYAAVAAWMRSPLVMVLLILFIVCVFYHAQLGIQIVIEDYIHAEWLKLGNLVLFNFLMVALALACIVAVLRVALGA